MAWKRVGWTLLVLLGVLALCGTVQGATAFWAPSWSAGGQTSYAVTNLDSDTVRVVAQTADGVQASRTLASGDQWVYQHFFTPTTDGRHNDALRFVADGNTSIVSSVSAGATDGAVALLSEGMLGTSYHVVALPGEATAQDGSTLHIVASESAEITLQSTVAIPDVGLGAPGTTTFTMAAFEHAEWHAPEGGDWTGTTISSDTPIAVFVSNDHHRIDETVPPGSGATQLWPSGHAGQAYATCGTATERGDASSDRLRILAVQAATIQFPGTARPELTLAAGQHRDVSFQGGLFLQSDAPVLVLERVMPAPGMPADLDMRLLVPIERWGAPSVSYSDADGTGSYAVHVIHQGNTWMSSGLTGTLSHTIPVGNGFTCGVYTGQSGNSTMRASDANPIHLTLHGKAANRAFGYSHMPFVAGASDMPLATQTTTGTQTTITQTGTTGPPPCPTLVGANSFSLEAGTTDYRIYASQSGPGTLAATGLTALGWQFDATSGRLTVIGKNDVGTHDITITLTPEDTSCQTDSKAVTVTVRPSTAACPMIDEAQPSHYELDAGIAWRAPVYLSTTRPWTTVDVAAPTGLNFLPESRSLSWAPTPSDEGRHELQVRFSFANCDDLVLSATIDVRPTLAQQHANPDCPSFLPSPDAFDVVAGHALSYTFRSTSPDGMPYSLHADLPFGATLHPQNGLLSWHTEQKDLGSHGPIVLRLVAKSDACNAFKSIHIHVVAPPPDCPTLAGHTDVIDIVAGVPTEHTWTIDDPDNVGHVLEMLPPTRFRVSGPGLPPTDEPLRTGLDNVTVTLEANSGDIGTFGGGYVALRTGNEHCTDIERPLALRVVLPTEETLEPETDTLSLTPTSTTPTTPPITMEPEPSDAPAPQETSQTTPLPLAFVVLGVLAAFFVRRRLAA